MITTILLASVITIIFLYVMYENYKLKKSLTHVENMYEQLRKAYYQERSFNPMYAKQTDDKMGQDLTPEQVEEAKIIIAKEAAQYKLTH